MNHTLSLSAGLTALVICAAVASGVQDAAGDPANPASGESWWSGIDKPEVIETLGIVTISLVILTAAAGLFMRKKPKLLVKWHKRLAVLTILAALLHGAMAYWFFG